MTLNDLEGSLRHSPAQLLEILRLWLTLAYVDARLGLLPSSWNRSWLFRGRSHASATIGTRTRERISALALLLRSVARFRVRKATPCLSLALALRSRLAPLGIKPWLIYGARRASGTSGIIDAHAWLELDGIKLDPYGSSNSFSPFTDRARGMDTPSYGVVRSRLRRSPIISS
jgi:hypothetical protein